MSNIVELDPEENETFRRMDRIRVIVEWSSQMCKEGRMPHEVAQAFEEHFGGGGRNT